MMAHTATSDCTNCNQNCGLIIADICVKPDLNEAFRVQFIAVYCNTFEFSNENVKNRSILLCHLFIVITKPSKILRCMNI